MRRAQRIKRQVQDRDDWCECGNGRDRATVVSIAKTNVRGERKIVDHVFSIWYCDECDGIVDVLTD